MTFTSQCSPHKELLRKKSFLCSLVWVFFWLVIATRSLINRDLRRGIGELVLTKLYLKRSRDINGVLGNNLSSRDATGHTKDVSGMIQSAPLSKEYVHVEFTDLHDMYTDKSVSQTI